MLWKRDALRHGFQDLVLNKLDARLKGRLAGQASHLHSLYRPKGGTVYHVPRDDAYRRTLQPVIGSPGWSEHLRNRQFADLPAEQSPMLQPF